MRKKRVEVVRVRRASDHKLLWIGAGVVTAWLFARGGKEGAGEAERLAIEARRKDEAAKEAAANRPASPTPARTPPLEFSVEPKVEPKGPAKKDIDFSTPPKAERKAERKADRGSARTPDRGAEAPTVPLSPPEEGFEDVVPARRPTAPSPDDPYEDIVPKRRAGARYRAELESKLAEVEATITALETQIRLAPEGQEKKRLGYNLEEAHRTWNSFHQQLEAVPE